MLILKAAALAIVVCVLVLCLKKDQPGFAFLLSLCGAAGLLWFAVQQLRPLLARLQQLAGQAGGDSFSILLQVLAIAFFVKLAMAYFDYRKHGQFEWTGPAILFVCLIFVLLAPNYIWGIVGL